VDEASEAMGLDASLSATEIWPQVFPIQPLELDIEVRGRNNLGEIDCQSNVAGGSDRVMTP
jgi:hypothetical protein